MGSERPSEVVDRLRRTYLGSDAVDHAIDLSPLFETPAAGERGRRADARGATTGGGPAATMSTLRRAKRVEARADALAGATPVDLGLDEVSGLAGALDHGTGTARWYCRFHEVALALAGVLVDVVRQYPAVDADRAVAATRAALGAVRSDASEGTDALRTAADAVDELATVVRRGSELRAAVEGRRFVHPDDTAEAIDATLRAAIVTGDRGEMAATADRLERALSGEWTREDLLAFDPYQFERLVGALWVDHRNAAGVTQASQDHGIDVVAERPDGTTVLIQAKRYQPGNTVGIETVQRTAGLLVEFDADVAVVVTSSSFTGSARDSAAGMDEVQLVDGERLVDLLTASDLLPPTPAADGR